MAGAARPESEHDPDNSRAPSARSHRGEARPQCAPSRAILTYTRAATQRCRSQPGVHVDSCWRRIDRYVTREGRDPPAYNVIDATTGKVLSCHRTRTVTGRHVRIRLVSVRSRSYRADGRRHVRRHSRKLRLQWPRFGIVFGVDWSVRRCRSITGASFLDAGDAVDHSRIDHQRTDANQRPRYSCVTGIGIIVPAPRAAEFRQLPATAG